MASEKILTLDNGAPIGDNAHSLTAGPFGPVIVDTVLFEKSAAFNRERIPERSVHARGAGAYGTFTVTHDITKYTKAKMFSEIGKKTPMFSRISTVAGERGTSDVQRDVRGFALKFYTEEGNWDLVGNDQPVFFVRDAFKFMDVNHSLKRDPRNNLTNPTSFWDFWSLTPESTHLATILFSDRGTPKGFRFVHGFGIHAYSMINAKNERTYVKFHWRTQQGIQNFTNDEAIKMSGEDPEHATRDLYEAIERKEFPKWKFYIQVMTEEQAAKNQYAFDSTKTWSHKEFPLIEFGEFELNQNVTNYFAEVEQAAFSPAHVVPGISFSPDKLLLGRMVSYADAHRYRLGANYHYLPVNRPRCPFHSYNVDGFMNFKIESGYPYYEPNSFNGPHPDPKFADAPMKLHGEIVVDRFTPSSEDDFVQPGQLFRLMSPDAQDRLCDNIARSLGTTPDFVIQRMVGNLTKCDKKYGEMVQEKINKLKK
eukprot:Phypoly_transcript_05695.p1 GENE.Phypoly_transcript_05695~~Phypoly_transcript_05695.p1  ORF type:complete len:480 (+),score=100.79 Phypoly_transcript_05695:432-1871(+)